MVSNNTFLRLDKAGPFVPFVVETLFLIISAPWALVTSESGGL